MFSYKLGTVFALLSVAFAPLVSASRIPMEARQVGSCFKCWKTMDNAEFGTFALAESDYTPTEGSTIDGEGTIGCYYVLASDSNRQTFCSYDSLTGELVTDVDKVCYEFARFPQDPEKCHDGRITQTAEQAVAFLLSLWEIWNGVDSLEILIQLALAGNEKELLLIAYFYDNVNRIFME